MEIVCGVAWILIVNNYYWLIVLKLSSDEISKATAGNELLGKGGYGTVYVGTTNVAVKYLNEVQCMQFMLCVCVYTL